MYYGLRAEQPLTEIIGRATKIRRFYSLTKERETERKSS